MEQKYNNLKNGQKSSKEPKLIQENQNLIRANRDLQQEVNLLQNSLNHKNSPSRDPSKLRLLEAHLDSETHKNSSLTRENIKLKS